MTFSPASPLDITICTLESFPQGAAQTVKLGLFARALQHQGYTVRILALDSTENIDLPKNIEVQGVFHGIPFEYSARRTTRAPGLLRRNWLKWYAPLVALWTTFKRPRPRTMVLFVHDAARLLFLLLGCRLLGIPTVLDFCEWMPSLPNSSFANRWGYNSGAVFSMTDGVIPVSQLLERRLHSVTPEKPSYYLCNLVDPEEFRSFTASPESRPYLLWAGSLDQYQESIRFVLSAFVLVHQVYPEMVLVLCGRASPISIADIRTFSAELGLKEEHVLFPGFISREVLLSYYRGASALLAPLENDERSRARFPFKLGEYLLAGRPVVSSLVGDVPLYLQNKLNAMLAEPDDPASFASCIHFLLDDPERAAVIAKAGTAVALSHFDFSAVGASLGQFLESVARTKD